MPAQQKFWAISGEKAKDQKISLLSLSGLTGFPVEMLKNELLLSDKVGDHHEISMEELREAMCYYLNLTMFEGFVK